MTIYAGGERALPELTARVLGMSRRVDTIAGDVTFFVGALEAATAAYA